MEIYIFVLFVLAGLIALLIWLAKGSGYKEAEKDGLQETLDIIEANKKVVWRNEKRIDNLSPDELNKLRSTWERD